MAIPLKLLVFTEVLAGLAFMFSSSILLQILVGVINVFLRDDWMDAAKFLTGASAVGSIAIPIILMHADLIQTGAMFIEFVSFVIFVCRVLCFHRASLDDEW